jgi:DivIVA domain-containing protein
MILLFEVLAVLAVVFGVAVVLTGKTDGLSEEARDLADTGIPRDRPMTPQDVIGLRFALAFRGYRMAEVDDALDRLAAELAARDEALARLRSGTAEPAAPAESAPAEPAPYVPSDATGELPPGLVVDVPPAPDAGQPDGYEPAFREPEPDPAPDPAGAAAPPVPAAETASIFTAPEPAPGPAPAAEPPPWAALDPATNPFRPEVPEIPTYDPWSVTPRSRYTDGPTYVEVDHPDDQDEHVDAITEHHTGHAPVAPPADESEEPEERPKPPWQS